MTSILDKSFVYHNAASHGDPAAFRARMRDYRLTPATSKWDKPHSGAWVTGFEGNAPVWVPVTP